VNVLFQNASVAESFRDIMHHDDGKICDLLSWSIMPNHIHAVFQLLRDTRIDVLIQAWKSVSSKRASAILERIGTFWQSDYFDVLVRDSLQLRRTVEYVLQNPAKAGLGDWPWVWANSEKLSELGI